MLAAPKLHKIFGFVEAIAFDVMGENMCRRTATEFVETFHFLHKWTLFQLIKIFLVICVDFLY